MRRAELDGVLAYGHWGRPVLVFPAQEGSRWEWEQRGMVDAVAWLIDAGRVRLRPILMTTLALVAGMLPVALGTGEGGDFSAPLGRAVIGGTLTSTVLTLVVIPAVYSLWKGHALASGHAAAAATPDAAADSAVAMEPVTL